MEIKISNNISPYHKPDLMVCRFHSWFHCPFWSLLQNTWK